MAALTVQDISLTDITPSFVAADVAGDTFVNDGKTFFELKNTNASPRVATIDSTAVCNYGFDHNVAVTVPATTGNKVVGPFPVSRFGTTVTVTYDAVANLTVAAFSV